MSFDDGKVSAENYEEIQRECMKKCQNNQNKDSCYKQCVENYDSDKCLHYRKSKGIVGSTGNYVPCLDFFYPTAEKYGQMPKF